MKTIQGRITIILIITLILISGNGLISLYYLSQISNDITQITEKDLTAQKSAEDMKSALQDLKKEVHIFLYALKNSSILVSRTVIVPVSMSESTLRLCPRALGDHWFQYSSFTTEKALREECKKNRESIEGIFHHPLGFSVRVFGVQKTTA